MIVDSSALTDVFRDESDAEVFAEAIGDADHRHISAATYADTAAVMDESRNPVVSRRLDELLRQARFMIEPVTEAQVRIAPAAYRDFGRSSGHRAPLNFGDCFAYALAKAVDEPLLLKGKYFGHTDIKSALPYVLALRRDTLEL